MLDRAAHLRKNSDALRDHFTRCKVVLVWRGRCALDNAGPALFAADEISELVAHAVERVFLGLYKNTALFALDLPRASKPELPRGSFQDVRMAGVQLSADDFGLLGYARGMMHWHREAKHCGRCGSATTSAEAGFARACAPCERTTYPRTDPAVMILVTRDDQCLLARQPKFPPGMYSALAGFVEPGESVEACVRRETQEEVGLVVDQLRYHDSDPWPFPASLMLGYFASVADGEITLDDDELEEARWFTKAELAKPNGFYYPPKFSLAHHLIAKFIAS